MSWQGIITVIGVGLLLMVLGAGWLTFRGEGAWKNTLTFGGIYSVCKPDKYEVVCFVHKGASAMSCIPYQGVCK